MEATATKPVRSLLRADAMLRCAAAASGGVSLKELAAAAGSSSPAAMHMAETLVELGYLERRRKPSRYVIGATPFALARAWQDQRLERALREAVAAIRAVAPAASIAWCEMRGDQVLLRRHAPRHGPGELVPHGDRVLQPYSSIAGMVHHAWLGEAAGRAYRQAHPFEDDGLARWGSVAAFEAARDEIRSRGCFAHRALDDAQRLRLGVPVTEGSDGPLLGSFTIDLALAAGDEGQEQERRTIAGAIDAARVASDAMGQEAT